MITSELRETVRRLYQFRCGYCGVTEVDAGSGLEIDHYLPVSRGGEDLLENLIYCCSACNRFKGSVWASVD
ncbi:MAG: HNH endonuclease, partial [Blastocatellia bacterium]